MCHERVRIRKLHPLTSDEDSDWSGGWGKHRDGEGQGGCRETVRGGRGREPLQLAKRMEDCQEQERFPRGF